MEPAEDSSSPARSSVSSLAFLGILLSSLAVIAWLRSKAKTTQEQPIDSTHQASAFPKTDDSHEPSQFALQVPRSPSEADQSCKCCYRKTPWWKVMLDVLTFIVAVGAFAAATVYAYITYRMWQEMRTQTETSQKQLEQSQRPWVKIIDVNPRGNDPIVGGLSFQKVGPYKDAPDIRVQATIQIKLSLDNIGHSVADVTPDIELFMPPFSTSECWNRVSGEEKRFCGSPDMSAVTGQKLTLFPGERQPFDWYGGISTPIRPGDINRLPEGSGIVPALIVCVSYRHKRLPGLYQTRAVYEISRLDTHSRFFDIGECNLAPFRNSPITFCKGGVPAKLLKFDRNNMGDEAY